MVWLAVTYHKHAEEWRMIQTRTPSDVEASNQSFWDLHDTIIIDTPPSRIAVGIHHISPATALELKRKTIGQGPARYREFRIETVQA